MNPNYDTLVEWNWWPSRKQYRLYYPGFQYWESARNHVMKRLSDDSSKSKLHNPIALLRKDRADKAWQVPLIKLHGSTSWFRFSFDTEEETWVAASKFASQAHFNLNEFRTDLSNEFESDVRPIPAIIPPMLGKVAIDPAIQDQWKAAIEVLQRAEYLAIVGYSFPPSDLFMIRLLTEGLHRNDTLKRIWIVDLKPKPKDRERWEKKMRKLFFAKLFKKILKLNPRGTKRFLKDLAHGKLDRL